jgi:hypothetical protein
MALFQDLQRGQIISSQPIISALSAGMIVELTSTGWDTAADETVANGILMVDSVVAPDEETEMDYVYAGGQEGMARKIYVDKNGPVDVGDCVAITPQIDTGSTFAVGGKVYVGNGLLYDSAVNSGDPIGTVLEVETDGAATSRVKVSFKFVA